MFSPCFPEWLLDGFFCFLFLALQVWKVSCPSFHDHALLFYYCKSFTGTLREKGTFQTIWEKKSESVWSYTDNNKRPKTKTVLQNSVRKAHLFIYTGYYSIFINNSTVELKFEIKFAPDLHFSEISLVFCSLITGRYGFCGAQEPDFISELWVWHKHTPSWLTEGLPHRENSRRGSKHQTEAPFSLHMDPPCPPQSVTHMHTFTYTHSHVRRPGGPAVPEAEVHQTGSSLDCWAPSLLTER